MMRYPAILFLSACLLGPSGCMVGPKYVKPVAPTPQEFRGPTAITSDQGASWTPSGPNDQADRGKWWLIFGDARLDSLEDQLTVSNYNLQVAEARLRQARVAIRCNRASEFPTIGLAPTLGAERYSANTPYFNQALVNNGTGIFTFPLESSYEADLWGRVRRTVSSAKQEA